MVAHKLSQDVKFRKLHFRLSWCHPLQWRQNELDGVSNHHPHDCLLNRLFKAQVKRKHQSSAPLASVRGIYRWPVNSPHKGPVTRKLFPFDDIIMLVVAGIAWNLGTPIKCEVWNIFFFFAKVTHVITCYSWTQNYTFIKYHDIHILYIGFDYNIW